MSRGGNIQGLVHLQNQNYLGKESLSVVQKVINGHKIPLIVTTIMMKTMMKYNYTKEIVKGAPNDTQHQDNAHPKPVLSTVMCCCWPMYNVTWYLYPYYDIENTGLYKWKYIWNQTGNNSSIKSSNTPAWPHNFWYVCLLERVYFNY